MIDLELNLYFFEIARKSPYIRMTHHGMITFNRYLICDKFIFLAPYGNQAQSNFGWNLGGPPQAAPPYPMQQPVSYPSYPSQNYNQDNEPSEPGIEEEANRKKDAGPGSFAHYIIRWVSKKFL